VVFSSQVISQSPVVFLLSTFFEVGVSALSEEVPKSA